MSEDEKVMRMRQWLCIAALTGCGILGALLSHGAFSLLERLGAFGSGYEDHAHASLPLALCGVLLAACVAASLYVFQVVDGGSRSHVLALARDFGRSPATWPLLAVAVIAIATLAGMESFEGDVRDAFGSVPGIGVTMVAAIAACVGMAVRAFARWIADATESFIAAIASRLARAVAGARYRLRRADAVCVRRLDMLGRTCGNRAPPGLLA